MNLSHKPYILIGPGRWGTASGFFFNIFFPSKKKKKKKKKKIQYHSPLPPSPLTTSPPFFIYKIYIVKTGIPVTWSQIAGVSCLVETEIGDKSYEPSQGSHFFQNLTSFGVGLLSVNTQKDEGLLLLLCSVAKDLIC